MDINIKLDESKEKVKYESKKQELTIEHSGEVEELDKKHQEWFKLKEEE